MGPGLGDARRHALGRVLRATSDDPDTVRLMGADNNKIFGYATAIASAVVGIAGVYLAMRTNFDPSVGPARSEWNAILRPSGDQAGW